jgi:hypothetical protein
MYIFIHEYEDSMLKPTNHFDTVRRRDRESGNIMEGVNLFKVHCMHV